MLVTASTGFEEEKYVQNTGPCIYSVLWAEMVDSVANNKSKKSPRVWNKQVESAWVPQHGLARPERAKFKLLP